MLSALNTKLLLVIIALLASTTAYLGYQNHQLSIIADQVTQENRRLADRDAQYKADLAELDRYKKTERKKSSNDTGLEKKLKSYVP